MYVSVCNGNGLFDINVYGYLKTQSKHCCTPISKILKLRCMTSIIMFGWAKKKKPAESKNNEKYAMVIKTCLTMSLTD